MRSIFNNAETGTNPYTAKRACDMWTLPDFPNFSWDEDKIRIPLAIATEGNELFLERLANYDADLLKSLEANRTAEEINNSNRIEGGRSTEYSELFYMIAKKVGVPPEMVPISFGKERPPRLLRVIADSRINYDRELDIGRLLDWTGLLFPLGVNEKGMRVSRGYRLERVCVLHEKLMTNTDDTLPITTLGKEVSYSPPPPEHVPFMMDDFLKWFNDPADRTPFPIKAALAHLWFVVIHPFTDGNGRTARVLVSMLLARQNKACNCLYSLSEQFEANRAEYYDALKISRAGTMDVTPWILYFLKCYQSAIIKSENLYDMLDRQRRSLFSFERYARIAKASGLKQAVM